MTTSLNALAAALLAVGLVSTAAQAAPAKTGAKAPACPFCKMPLSTKATKDTPVAITVSGKKYYTCAPCKPKVAAMKTTKPMMKPMMKPMAKM